MNVYVNQITAVTETLPTAFIFADMVQLLVTSQIAESSKVGFSPGFGWAGFSVSGTEGRPDEA